MKSGRSVSQGCSANWRKLSKQIRVGIWLRVSALGCSCLPTVSLTHSLSTWCEAGVTIWGCHLSFKKGILCRNLKQCNSRQVLAESIRLFCFVFLLFFSPQNSRIPGCSQDGEKRLKGQGRQWRKSARQCLSGERRQRLHPQKLCLPLWGMGPCLTLLIWPWHTELLPPWQQTQHRWWFSLGAKGSPPHGTMTRSQTEAAKSAFGPSGFSTGLGSHLFSGAQVCPLLCTQLFPSESGSGKGFSSVRYLKNRHRIYWFILIKMQNSPINFDIIIPHKRLQCNMSGPKACVCVGVGLTRSQGKHLGAYHTFLWAVKNLGIIRL